MKPLALAPIAFCFSATAQNLVPNPSFEFNNGCPTDDGQMTLAEGWVSYLGTADLWHACGTPELYSVPYNLYSYQQARHGVAYSGYHAFTSLGDSAGGYREYLGTRLSSPLSVGLVYHVEFYVSWTTAEDGMQGSVRFANNNLGAYFTTTERFIWDWYPLPNHAHVSSTQIVTDSVGWSLIEGSFVADSAYAYVYFGNFFGDAETDHIMLNPGGQFNLSYYYLEDVCVALSGDDCSVLTNASTVGMSSSGSRFFFVPGEGLWLTNTTESADWVIYDALGGAVRAGSFGASQGDGTITLPDCVGGVYLAVVNLEGGAMLTCRFVVQ